MSIAALVLLLAGVPISPAEKGGTSPSGDTSWRRSGRMTGLLPDSCFRPPHRLRTCIEKRLRRAFDEDVIRISEGVELVRCREGDPSRNNRNPRLVQGNDPSDEEVDWNTVVVQGVEQLLRTHALKIHLKIFNRALEGARGHRKNMFNQMLMFGVIVASLIVIPLGFQFLAILGGKALLLSKMALILASIQGLKKIATSNLNYGLYSYGPEAYGPCKQFDEGCGEPYYEISDRDVFFSIDIEGLDGHYDRQWQQEGYRLQNYGNVEEYKDVLHPRKDLLHDFQTT